MILINIQAQICVFCSFPAGYRSRISVIRFSNKRTFTFFIFLSNRGFRLKLFSRDFRRLDEVLLAVRSDAELGFCVKFLLRAWTRKSCLQHRKYPTRCFHKTRACL